MALHEGLEFMKGQPRDTKPEVALRALDTPALDVRHPR
jgi:hypothetical protein